jgi:hypothetical protein
VNGATQAEVEAKMAQFRRDINAAEEVLREAAKQKKQQ